MSAPRPTAAPGPEIVAHRGDPIAQVENTLPAIRAAVEAGARTVEIDVRVSADGVPVLLHDETTARIWGRAVPAHRQTLGELAALRAPGSDASVRIPTLAEALRAAAPARLLIDLPDAASALASLPVVAEARCDHGVPAPAWCGSEDGLRAVRAADAGREDAGPDDAAEIWLSRGVAELPAAALVQELRPFTWNPEHVHVTAAAVDAARALGMRTSCWTVDDPARARELAQLGVHAIISNRSAVVREHLEEKTR